MVETVPNLTPPGIVPASGKKPLPIAAVTIGNVLEWYDWGVYGFLVPTISKLFFPAEDPLTSILWTFAVFGVGFFTRPLGAILFGMYGDRHGRRKAMSAMVFLMGLATFCFGLLPTYADIGIAAPIILVTLRLIQGVSAGGEYSGSAAYLVEYAPTRRGFFGSWVFVGTAGGALAGALVAAILNSLTTPEVLMAWAWRIPFLLGILIGLIGAYYRWQLGDTPKFLEVQDKGQIPEHPFIEAVTVYPRETAIAFFSNLFNTVAYYTSLIYMTSYMTSVAKIPQATTLWINTLGIVFLIVLVPPMGALSDRLGRRPVMMASCIGFVFLAYPLYVMAGSGSVLMALLAQIALVAMFAPMPGQSGHVFGDFSDADPIYRAVARVQYVGDDLRRVRTLHRNLPDQGHGV